MPVTPTPTQQENDKFITDITNGTHQPMPWYHQEDGSPVEPGQADPGPHPPTYSES